jgi:hypothetical protein
MANSSEGRSLTVRSKPSCLLPALDPVDTLTYPAHDRQREDRLEWHEGLVCSQCGSREIAMVAAGAKR